jgi:hypothetical protein
MHAQANLRSAVWTGPGRLKIWITVAIIMTTVALGYRGDSGTAATVQSGWSLELSRDLHRALDTLVSLRTRAMEEPFSSPQGDTVTFLVPSETAGRRVDRIAVYVDKERGGLWARRDGDRPRLLASTVDRMSLETEPVAHGDPRGLALRLSAARAHRGGIAMRRSLERLLPPGTLCEG